MTLILSNEILKQRHILPASIGAAVVGVDDLGIDNSSLGLTVGKVSAEFSVRLIVVLVVGCLSALIYYCCSVELNCCDQVLKLVLLVHHYTIAVVRL